MMKNRFILLGLTLLASLSLASCNGGHMSANKNNLSSDLPAKFDESRNYEITFIAKNDSNKTQQDVYKSLVTRFEEYYTNIKVNLILETSYDDIYNKVVSSIQSNTIPDVCIAYPDHIAQYAKSENLVLDLTSYMYQESYGLGGADVKFDSVKREEIVPKFLEECKIDGKYYALPFVRASEALYLNKTYLETKLNITEVPEYVSWDWIWDVTSKARALHLEELKNGTKTDKTFYPFFYKSTDNMLIQMLKQYNYDYTNDYGEVLLFNDNTAGILDTLADKAANNEFSTFKFKAQYPANYFNKWEVIMAVDSTAGATWMGCDATSSDSGNVASGDRFETIVRAVPQADVNNPYMISQGPSVCTLNKGDEQQAIAAWLFTQFLLNDETQTSYPQTEGYVPVTTRVINSNKYNEYLNDSSENQVKIDATKLVLKNIDHTFITSVFPGSVDVRNAAQALVENTVNKYTAYSTTRDSQALYNTVISNYHLADLMNIERKITTEAYVLIGVLIVAWVGIGLYASINYASKRRKKKKNSR